MTKERGRLVAALAALLPIAGGCNAILGIDSHALQPGAGGGTGGTGGAGGATGTGGMAGAVACGADAAVNDDAAVDAGAQPTCGFPMPNPVNAPGTLPNRASYDPKDPAQHTIKDKITGLTWEAELDPTDYAQEEAIRHCHAKGGDWRLPTRIELISLVDFTVAKPGPTIDVAFANDPVWAVPPSRVDYRKFWTSSHAVCPTSTGWAVDFADGTAHQKPSGQFKARCVSGTPSRCPAPRYEVQGSSPDEEVVDGFTGLIWRRAIAGPMFWRAATTFCPAGFRLPGPGELQSIVDETTEFPSSFRTWFPGTPDKPFWTSAPQAGVSGFAWYVTFAHGHSDFLPTDETDMNNKLWVRCVR